jgi:CheY-like chemotaxis protein
VLDFGRGLAIQRTEVNPVHLVREMQKLIKGTFPKNVVFDFKHPRDLWTVTCDPTQLHQVLMNLCVNARDAMPKGGKLTVTLDNCVLDEVYAGMNPESKPGAYVLVKVADTGTGIPRAIQARIFEPFFTTKEVGKGTGLGLSTTLAIVRSHGGFIHLASELGQGTTFEVYLPATSTAQAAESVAAEAAQLHRGNGELVLIVDDEMIIRTIAGRTLERHGYRVLLAAHGAEALAHYAQHRGEIAVVLTDMDMPIMDGPATIIALRSVNPEVKIITSSGHPPGAGRERFLPKPYTSETMLKTLAEVLRKDTGRMEPET